jgi:nitrile hydratase
MLTDFGMSLPADTEIRVWDSTWDEDRLAGLVTRDSMIGTGMPRRPEEVGM